MRINEDKKWEFDKAREKNLLQIPPSRHQQYFQPLWQSQMCSMNLWSNSEMMKPNISIMAAVNTFLNFISM